MPSQHSILRSNKNCCRAALLQACSDFSNMASTMLLSLLVLLAHATATPTRALLQAPVRTPPRCERPTLANNNLGVTCEGVGREWSGDEINCRWDGVGGIILPWLLSHSTRHKVTTSWNVSMTRSCCPGTAQTAPWMCQALAMTAALTVPSSTAGYAPFLLLCESSSG